jgi:meso-butanediol dehydrogenase/(S,S)-butanediol dehydrogenase/diacetyl reductase
MVYQSLYGKRVIVTGGASGIGLATARRFAEEGSVVGIIDVNERAGEVALREGGIRHAQVADVSRAGDVEAALERLSEQLGGLDVMIANAGISVRTPFLEVTPSQWRQVLGVNLDGIFYCAQFAARRMAGRTGGVILMTASTNGLEGHSFYADYNASKAGVILLARSMAVELAPAIRVNAVCPGYVMTPMQMAEYTEEMIKEVNEGIPLKRHARPEEVAALYAFLASSEAEYITGQAICIDGGETA